MAKKQWILGTPAKRPAARVWALVFAAVIGLGLAGCPAEGNGGGALSSIGVDTQPVKTEYTAGEKLATAGLKVKAYYDGGTYADVTTFTTDPANDAALNTAGSQTVTVSYTEDGVTKTTAFSVRVSPEGALSSIGVSALPTKTEYKAGDRLATVGLKVKAYYDGGTYADVTAFTTDPANDAALNTAGSQTVTVSYTEGGVTKTADFLVMVDCVPTVDVSKPDASKYPTTGTWVGEGEGQRFKDSIDRYKGDIWDAIDNAIRDYEDSNNKNIFDSDFAGFSVNQELTLSGGTFNGKKFKVLSAGHTSDWTTGDWDNGGTEKSTESWKVELADNWTDGDFTVYAGSKYERKRSSTGIHPPQADPTSETWEEERGISLIASNQFDYNGSDITRNGVFIYWRLTCGSENKTAKTKDESGPEEVWVYNNADILRFHHTQDNDDKLRSVF